MREWAALEVIVESCPNDEEVAALARGELEGEVAAKLQQHVNGCAGCFGKFLRGGQADTGNAETGVLVGAPRWAEPPRAIDWKPGRDLGRYVLLQELGRGGMGVVFSAYDKELDRAVALKVLHPQADDASTAGGQARLLREAQAMARLSHPNVVAVHDVAVLEQRVCVVMELVEGSTVREWLKAAPRPWREVVAVFRAAGEGLAAAHAANLIHRDFKPDNLLIGKDGRVRVTDFGIARLGPQAGADGDHPSSPDDLESGSAGTTPHGPTPGGRPSPLASALTQEGAVVGTPRYMAPEQYRRGVGNFRTDQFSLAVSLYEALYGQFPFAGKNAAERMEHAERGEVRPAPAGSKVPPAIHRLLQRALSPDPERRFGSMHELLVELAKDPAVVRRRLAVGASAVALVGLAIGFTAYQTRQRTALCSGSEARLAGVWDDAQREAIHASFAKTRVPFAEDSFQLAAAALDAYASEWVRTRKDTCEATRVRGEQPEQVMTLRMVCLERRRDALSALTEVFARADPGLVAKAKQSIDSLPTLAYCDDVAALSAAIPPPEDPKKREQVDRLRSELTRGEVLVSAGRPAEAEPKVRAALAEANQLGYAPVQAEAEVLLGSAVSRQQRVEESIGQIERGFNHALASGHWDIVSAAALALASGYVALNRVPSAWQWLRIGAAATEHVSDPRLKQRVISTEGFVQRSDGNFGLAFERLDQAYTFAAKQFGPDHMITIGARFNRANTLNELGRWTEAERDMVEILATGRRALGPKHQLLSFPLVVAADIALARGHLADAREKYLGVMKSLDEGTYNIEFAHEGFGQIAIAEGNLAQAREEFATSRDLFAKLSADRPDLLRVDARVALLDLEEGHPEKARAALTAIIDRAKGNERLFDEESFARLSLARVELATQRPARALEQAENAVARWTKRRAANHPFTLEARSVAAAALLELGRTAEATARAAQTISEALPQLGVDPPLVARSHLTLGRAALTSGDLATARRELDEASRLSPLLSRWERARLTDANARLAQATVAPLPTHAEPRIEPASLRRPGAPLPPP